MPKRPKWFLILSLVMLLIAISIPIQLMTIYKMGVTDILTSFYFVSVLNLIMAGALAVSAMLLLNASPLTKYMMPITLLVVAWNNYVVGSYGHDFSMTTTSLATLGFGALCGTLLKSKYLVLFKKPNMRWWLTPKRIKTSLHTQINPHVGQNLFAETYDLSETGVYIPFGTCRMKDKKEVYELPEIGVGDFTTLQIRISQFQIIKCDAMVVRVAEDSPHHPAGMGLQFVNLDSKSRASIRRYAETF